MKAGACLAAILMSVMADAVAAAESTEGKRQTLTPKANYERTIGVCHPIENKLDSRLSAVNSMSPLIDAMAYIEKIEHKKFSDAEYLSLYNAAKMTLLQLPTHGELGLDNDSGSYFSSDYNYTGPDRATVLVEFGAYKVKVMYYFELMHGVPGSNDAGSAPDNKAICPNGRVWKISFSPDAPMIKGIRQDS